MKAGCCGMPVDCDLTTSPDGKLVSAGERMAETKQRYGPGDIVTRFITEGSATVCCFGVS